MTETLDLLPAEIDRRTTIFSYGSLLNHRQLRELLKTRGEFQIHETQGVQKAARLIKENPNDIVILKNVFLENVRVSIITETMLRRWYREKGGDLETLIRAGVTTREVPQAVFLYARPAAPNEKGRFLNGGLICNLTREEVLHLDRYEFEPVLKRTRAPQIKIGGRGFFPNHIAFYAGSASTADITAEEKAERARFLNLNRKYGQISPQAGWQKNVRKRDE